MRDIKRPVVIFALNTPNDELRLRKAGLKANNYKRLQGMYKGIAENSYIVDMAHIDLVIDLAIDHKQESIMVLDEDRNAKLVYLADMREESLGQLIAVSEKEAMNQLAYTYNPETKQFFITVR